MARTKKQIEESQDEEFDSLDEDSVSDNVDTSPLEGMSKTNAISIVMKQMADDQDHWVDIFNAVQAQVGTFSQSIPDDAAAKNMMSTAMKGAIKEDIAAVFGDAKDLSEEFKQKASILFESAVNSRVALIESDLQEQYAEALEEELEEITEGLVEQIDDYLSFAVEEWAAENEVAIEHSVRSELAENFIQNLGQLFIEHNFNVPEEQVDIVEMLADKNDSLSEDFNKVYADNIELSRIVEELQKTTIISEISENLTPTEKEKFKTLSEGFDLDDDIETYVEKLATIKEHHFGKKTVFNNNNTRLITEEIEYSEEDLENENNKNVSPNMKRYVQALESTRSKF